MQFRYSSGSACEPLGDLSCQRQLETYALECFDHQENPQNKTEQAQEIQQKHTQREGTPITDPAKPPAHAKNLPEQGAQNM